MIGDLEFSTSCRHIMSQGREGEKGSWCCACGVKVLDVEARQCSDCKQSQTIWGRTICNRHMMYVTPDMHVTFKVSEGSCWEAKS